MSFSGLLAATVEWFKIYKVPDGKPENQFAFDGKAKNAAFAVNIVQSLNAQWKTMMGREAEPEEVSRYNDWNFLPFSGLRPLEIFVI